MLRLCPTDHGCQCFDTMHPTCRAKPVYPLIHSHLTPLSRSLSFRRCQVSLTTRELSGQDLTKFYGEINSILRALVQSVDSDDKLCGVHIIGKPSCAHRRCLANGRMS